MTAARTAASSGNFRFEPLDVQNVPLGGSGRIFLTARVAQLLNVSRTWCGSGSPGDADDEVRVVEHHARRLQAPFPDPRRCLILSAQGVGFGPADGNRFPPHLLPYPGFEAGQVLIVRRPGNVVPDLRAV